MEILWCSNMVICWIFPQSRGQVNTKKGHTCEETTNSYKLCLRVGTWGVENHIASVWVCFYMYQSMSKVIPSKRTHNQTEYPLTIPDWR